MRKKWLSVLLTFAMLLSLVPVIALAEGDESDETDGTDGTVSTQVQDIIVRRDGVEDGVEGVEYSKAYAAAGLKLSERPVDGVYTLTIDEVALRKIVDAHSKVEEGEDSENGEDNNTYMILENGSNPGKLWFGMEYTAPDGVSATKATVRFDKDGDFGAVELIDAPPKGFYNYIKVYDADDDDTIGPVSGETAEIKWFDDSLGTETLLAITEAKLEVVVEYTVTFDADGGELGSVAESVKVAAGGTVSAPTSPPTQAGYKFIGWYEKDSETVFDFATVIDRSLTLYAKWEEDNSSETPTTKYTVTFDANGGSLGTIPERVEVTAGETVTEPESAPIKDGFKFIGWYEQGSTTAFDFATAINRDITLYAKWEEDNSSETPTTKYTVMFNANEGSLGTIPESVEVTAGETVTEPESAPTRTGYTFGGWFKEATCTTEWNFASDTVTSNITLYAKWTQNTAATYTVTFNANGGSLGSVAATQTVAAGGKVTRPTATPTRTGYTFGGWFKEAACTTEWNFGSDTVTSNITLYAKWTQNTAATYTVTFNANGGSLGDVAATQTVAAGGKVTKPTATPTREGYTFGGWFKEAACTNEWKFDTDTVTANLTLYAKWEKDDTSETPKEYKVTFVLNGGTGDATSLMQTVAEGGKVTKPADPTRDGYTFAGWYKDEALTQLWDFDKDTVTDNVTLTAKWTPNSTTTPGDDVEYSIRLASGIRHGSVYLSDRYAAADTWVSVTVYPSTDYEVSWVRIERADGRRIYPYQSGQWYTFKMPACDVTVDVGFTLQAIYNTYVYYPPEPADQVVAPALSFPAITWRPAVVLSDVPVYDWSYPSAQWAYQNGYLNLEPDGTFRLSDPVSHMQMWRIMARWMGVSAMDDQSVTNWALQNGAARSGSGSASMTRQNVVEYLYQCCFLMGGDMTVTGNLSGYRDSQLITSAASKNAWLWAVNKGLISGTADGYLNPGAEVSRGEFAAILMRLSQSGIR